MCCCPRLACDWQMSRVSMNGATSVSPAVRHNDVGLREGSGTGGGKNYVLMNTALQGPSLVRTVLTGGGWWTKKKKKYMYICIQ